MSAAARELIAGVVVLYNPPVSVLDTIRSYLPQIGRLFAVDNSETPDPEIVRQIGALPGVTYHANGGNLGVAAALNAGAAYALAHGYRYLLTMDQDSRAASGMVADMQQCLSGQDVTRVGIISPVHVTKPGSIPARTGTCRTVQYVMTSGNLLDLQAYQAVGPFREDLFIDFIDVEYCLRLNARGFSVFQALNTHLDHQVGNLVDVRIVRSLFRITSHSPLRMYYKTRNRFIVSGLYRSEFPAFGRRDAVRFFLEMCRLLLFEPMKGAKIRMMWRGWCDYRRGKLGKYDEYQD